MRLSSDISKGMKTRVPELGNLMKRRVPELGKYKEIYKYMLSMTLGYKNGFRGGIGPNRVLFPNLGILRQFKPLF